jgi:hypothetical protein
VEIRSNRLCPVSSDEGRCCNLIASVADFQSENGFSSRATTFGVTIFQTKMKISSGESWGRVLYFDIWREKGVGNLEFGDPYVHSLISTTIIIEKVG